MKHAFVIGGSSGLGAATIAALAPNHVCVEFSRSAPYPFSHRLDLGCPGPAVRTFVRAVRHANVATSEGCILLHCAANVRPTTLNDDIPSVAAVHTLNANITTPMLLIKHFLRMTAAVGVPTKIAVVTSGLAQVGRAGAAIYSMSKAALERLLESYREEAQLGRHAHSIFLTVGPGMFGSPLWHRVVDTADEGLPLVADMRHAAEEYGLPEPSGVGQRLAAALVAAEHSGVITLEESIQ